MYTLISIINASAMFPEDESHSKIAYGHREPDDLRHASSRSSVKIPLDEQLVSHEYVGKKYYKLREHKETLTRPDGSFLTDFHGAVLRSSVKTEDYDEWDSFCPDSGKIQYFTQENPLQHAYIPYHNNNSLASGHSKRGSVITDNSHHSPDQYASTSNKETEISLNRQKSGPVFKKDRKETQTSLVQVKPYSWSLPKKKKPRASRLVEDRYERSRCCFCW